MGYQHYTFYGQEDGAKRSSDSTVSGRLMSTPDVDADGTNPL
jgi:hypothetical protein